MSTNSKPCNPGHPPQTTGTYATAPTYCWAESYTYDAWGNLLSDQPNPSTQSAYTGCTAEATFSTTANAKNQIALLTYDAAGNVITSCGMYMAAPATCTYDAENHLTQFSWSGGSNTYTYDGDGKRVMKSGSPGTIYWYGAGSAVQIETDLSNNNQAGYAYFNGQRALRLLPSNEVGFYFTDHLGNTRYFQSLAGDNVSDFYPFGGERVYSTGTTTHYKFTGKERDSESGLDNFDFRYFSSSLGRFMKPDDTDPEEHLGNPQGLNLYSYVQNNPTNATDPDGHDCIYINNDTGKYEGFNSGDCDNSTEEKANTGRYVDGTVNTITTTTGDANGVVTGYNGTSDTGTLLSGTFSTPSSSTPSDALNANAVAIFSDINRRNIIGNTFKIYGAGALIGATGGAACYYLCPAATVTTLGIATSPLLPIVPSALEKLQRLGMSLQEATAIVESPASQKLVDNLNNGNINVIQDVGGKLVRITLDPSGQRIISAGYVQARNVANSIASGRFTPQ